MEDSRTWLVGHRSEEVLETTEGGILTVDHTGLIYMVSLQPWLTEPGYGQHRKGQTITVDKGDVHDWRRSFGLEIISKAVFGAIQLSHLPASIPMQRNWRRTTASAERLRYEDKALGAQSFTGLRFIGAHTFCWGG